MPSTQVAQVACGGAQPIRNAGRLAATCPLANHHASPFEIQQSSLFHACIPHRDFRNNTRQIEQKQPSGADNKSSHPKVVRDQEDANPKPSDWIQCAHLRFNSSYDLLNADSSIYKLSSQTRQMAQAMPSPPLAWQLLERDQEGYYRAVWICHHDYAFNWSVRRSSDADNESSCRKVVRDEAGTEPTPSGWMHAACPGCVSLAENGRGPPFAIDFCAPAAQVIGPSQPCSTAV
ncbi:hypothetical protein BDV93DRAFT_514726 [Ceratobasidium sp. AG-I]|nr:hypothetical protein BDV93DRAFT_514726 [Ceratobasidium sp. AG-I]